MAPDSFVDAMLAEAKRYEDLARGLRAMAERIQTEGSAASEPKQSVNWRVADSIEEILAAGERSMPEDELLAKMADENLVKGKTHADKIANGRKALTLGVSKGYLRIESGNVCWVPGKRTNNRVRK